MIKKAEISDPDQVSKVINDFGKLPMSEQLFAAARVQRAHADDGRSSVLTVVSVTGPARRA